MFTLNLTRYFFYSILIFPFISGISTAETKSSHQQNIQLKAIQKQTSTTESIPLTVYKNPSCGCCKKWMKHLNEQGFKTQTEHLDDLTAIKTQYHIPPTHRSCHTAVLTSPKNNKTYAFEGHIPAKYIKQFLQNPPAHAVGLTVPAMPVGSPGMEYGNELLPYDVFLIKDDGTTSSFAQVKVLEEQY
ncbi:DUF411 domain-containing protein [Zooshikella harenae]|uniref:DUF411 domain-containing protein n=1 Tax=Zooshikella harenae TaxID=2827238 RepID=A0ABS5ZH17_9GAMM|nr:DUF411 domain-containing protein [Zooshikella harenae]MBU2713362.1 DUF411 domain-containing protein [Zooshikella harenae]